MAPCPGRCGFCGFGEEHTAFGASAMPEEEIVARAGSFTSSGELSILFLMTMHVFDFERLLQVVSALRNTIPCATQLVVNIGDFDLAQARDMKAAGVDGAEISRTAGRCCSRPASHPSSMPTAHAIHWPRLPPSETRARSGGTRGRHVIVPEREYRTVSDEERTGGCHEILSNAVDEL